MTDTLASPGRHRSGTSAGINDFWLADSLDSPERASARRDWWYRGGPGVDSEIRARFGHLVTRACNRDPELADWQETPDGALALILLLDQFTRNIHRGTVRAYDGDARAFEVVEHAIERGLDTRCTRWPASGSTTPSTTPRTAANRTADSTCCGP